jgi:glycosyltransferase involved in cell wall biosynthesis
MTELELFKRVMPETSDAVNTPSFLEKKVCVVLTAFNDEEAIPSAVTEFLSQKNVVKVIVVDNNSGDRTRLFAEDMGAEVVGERNQGYGFACIRGLKEALTCEDADVIVLAEGDMSFRGNDIWKLLPFVDDVDLVVGSRTHMALNDSQMDWFYLWGNLLMAKILQFRFVNARFLGRTRFSDVGCTMRAIRKSSLQRIIKDLSIGGHHFAPHMTMVALRNGLKVVEVPVYYRRRIGVSKGAGGNRVLAIKTGLKMLWRIIAAS